MHQNQNNLFQYLQKSKFQRFKIEKGTNSAARAIALKVYGNEGEHRKVALEVGHFIFGGKEHWKKELQVTNMKEYVSELRNGTRAFSDNEIKAAAKLYDVPIIVYSGALVKDLFFRVFPPMTYNGQ